MTLTRVAIVSVAIAIVGVMAYPQSVRLAASLFGRGGVTTTTFEPVYRAAKAVQGATASGVTYVRFVELLQGLSTALAIAKDHHMNEADTALMHLFDEAFQDYRASESLWKIKLDDSDAMWHDEIPIWIEGTSVDQQIGDDSTARYGFPVFDRALPSGTRYKAAPATAIQYVWRHADGVLDKASAVFYGRE